MCVWQCSSEYVLGSLSESRSAFVLASALAFVLASALESVLLSELVSASE